MTITFLRLYILREKRLDNATKLKLGWYRYCIPFKYSFNDLSVNSHLLGFCVSAVIPGDLPAPHADPAHLPRGAVTAAAL